MLTLLPLVLFLLLILLYRTISGLSPLTDGKFGIEKDAEQTLCVFGIA